MFGFAVMTAKAIVEGPGAEIRSFRVVRIPRLRISRHMSPRQHHGIALDWPIVHNTRMTGRAALPLMTRAEGLYMLSVAHDQTDVPDRRRQVPWRHFRCAENVLVATETHVGVHLGSQVMRFRGGSEQRDGNVFRARPCLVMDPACDPGSDMAGHTRHFFMRRLHPTVVRWSDRMAAGAECRMVGQRDGNSAECQNPGG